HRLFSRTGYWSVLPMKIPAVLLAALVSMVVLSGCSAPETPSGATEPSSAPLIPQRADPWIYRHSSGEYFFIATSPAVDRIEMRRRPTLHAFANAEPQVGWRKHAAGEVGANISAPELQYTDETWNI